MTAGDDLSWLGDEYKEGRITKDEYERRVKWHFHCQAYDDDFDLLHSPGNVGEEQKRKEKR